MEKKREDLLVSLRSCEATGESAAACRYHRQLGEQKRCSAVSFMKIDCPYLGKVLPHPGNIEEKKQEKKRLTITFKPPPEV